jgi:hypothetical protein
MGWCKKKTGEFGKNWFLKQEYDGIVNLELLVLVMSGGRKKLKLVIDTFFCLDLSLSCPIS